MTRTRYGSIEPASAAGTRPLPHPAARPDDSLMHLVADQLQAGLLLLLAARVDRAGDELHHPHLGGIRPFGDELAAGLERLLVADHRAARERARLGDGAAVHGHHLEALHHQIFHRAPLRSGSERGAEQVPLGVADAVALVAQTAAMVVEEPGAVAPDDADGLLLVRPALRVGPGVSHRQGIVAGGILACRRCSRRRTALAPAKERARKKGRSHRSAHLRSDTWPASSCLRRKSSPYAALALRRVSSSGAPLSRVKRKASASGPPRLAMA